MGRRWIADASPLIVLAKIGYERLLPDLCEELIIPSAVAEEIQAGASDDPARSWVLGQGSRYVRQIESLSNAVVSWDLGRGETTVLSYAHEQAGAEVIVDDRAARNCAVSLGIPVRGTMGVILLAKKAGIIRRAGPLLDDIAGAGLHVAPDVLRAAWRLAEED